MSNFLNFHNKYLYPVALRMRFDSNFILAPGKLPAPFFRGNNKTAMFNSQAKNCFTAIFL